VAGRDDSESDAVLGERLLAAVRAASWTSPGLLVLLRRLPRATPARTDADLAGELLGLIRGAAPAAPPAPEQPAGDLPEPHAGDEPEKKVRQNGAALPDSETPWWLVPFITNDEPKWSEDSVAIGAPAAEAVISHILDRPDGIRQRALNAATIAGAAAAVLAAFGGLGGLSQRHVAVQVLVGTALCMWLASVLLYVRVIAYSHRNSVKPLNLDAMLETFTKYAIQVRARVKLGTNVACFAVLLTAASVIAFAVDTIHASGRENKREHLVVAAPTALALATLCNWSVPAKPDGAQQIVATVRESDLAKKVVRVRLGDNSDRLRRREREDHCDGREIRMRATAVLVME
jgi:hypothetical protein